MVDIKLDIPLWPKQKEAWRVLNRIEKRRMFYGGARGGGKSRLARARQIYRRLKIPNSKGVIIRKTFPELQRNHIDKIKQEYPFLRDCYSEQKHRFTFPNGSILEMSYLQYDKDLDNFQGAEFEDIVIDEAQQHQRNVYEKLRACLRTNITGIVPQMLLTGNPGGIGMAWLKQEFIDPAEKGILPDDMAFIQATVDDNPSINPEYLQELDSLPDKLRRAWRYGDWTVFEGMFFPEFGPHLKEQPYNIPAHECNLYGSLDYGDGQGEHSGATSFGLWHCDKQGKPHRLFTYYKKHQTASVYAREILASIKSFSYTSGLMPKEIIADPSIFFKRLVDDENTKSIADIFGEYGLILTPAVNDRVMGWRCMREMFTNDDHDQPRSFYWDGYNNEYEQYIPTLIHSDTNPNDCEKGGEDHVGDESRYGFVRFMNMRAKAIVETVKEQNTGRKLTNSRALYDFNRRYANAEAGVY